MKPTPLLTRMLRELRSEDSSAAARVAELIYPELRKLARAHLAREQSGHILQPTALVNEAYLRWLESDDPATENDPPPLPANAGAPAPVAVADALDPELAALGAVGIDAHGYPIWGGAPDREDWSDDDGPYMGDYDTDNEYE